MNTFEKRSRYFRELSLYLQRNGFTTQDNLDQMLSVEWKELPLCRITEGASVLYRQKDIKNPGAESALHQATDIACTVYEYMAILDQAPTLKADGLAEPYRLISEFNGTVLAAKESRYGVEFTTWGWVNDHSSLWQGHYFGPGSGAKGYLAAKRDFAVRSGLLEQDQIFSDEQLSEMYRCVHETLDNCYPMTAERSKLLTDTAEQIERAVPQLEFLVEQSNLNEMEVLEQNQSMTQQYYDDLDKHELSDQLVKDIQSEIPQHPDASSICLPRDYSAQFPHIWERMSAQSPGVSATKDAPDLARSTHRIFKINDLFGQQVALQPRVELYPATTEELALLRNLGEKSGVTLRIYTRKVTSAEEEKILHNAENKNRMDRGSTNRMKQAVTAEANLQDVAALIASMRKNSEPLIHCAVFIELTAKDPDSLRALRDEVSAELVRSKLDADQLFLRQREGFLAVNPAGRNVFATQFERVLPAGSVANLFPFNYSGKTDPKGFYVGRDRYGSNVIVDLDRRAEDKTTASVLILGNSGQGKSYLLKLLLCNILESGKSVLCLDPEHELMDLCVQLGGCFIDLMSGQYRINPLQPKLWSDDDEEDPEAPDAFRQHTRLSQHISFLKDFFRSYKDFADRHIDTIELMLERLYAKWGIDDNTEVQSIQPEDFPTLSDLYDQIEEVYQSYDSEEDPLYTRDLLREILLGLHSMCRGAESKFFNGHTNITSSRFLVFGVKGLLQANSGVKNAMLFNVLSYLSDRLLTQGNAVATLDELYIWLSNLTMPGCFRAVGPEVS